MSQSRGDDRSLSDFFDHAAAEEEKGCLDPELQSISNFVIKKFTKAEGYTRIPQAFCEEFRWSLQRFLQILLKRGVQIIEETRRKKLSYEDLDTACSKCARPIL